VGTRRTAVDVRVWGGGPAAAAAARLLALWGHRVVVTAPRPSTSAELPESIPPSTGKLFDVLGVRDLVDAAGFVRASGNTVWWGGSEARVEPFPAGGQGWQATAPRLNARLMAAAIDAGASLLVARATPGELDAENTLTLDCTGRSGVISRHFDLRVHEPGPRTVALIGRWHVGPQFAVPDPTHTLIESYEDGWAWSVPLGLDKRSVAVMVDPERSNLARGRPSRDVYDREIAKTRRFRDLLAESRLLDGPQGWDASMYASRTYAASHWLLVGDAASFVDPLSSAGVKKALASGWLAAVVAHTSLVRPAMRETAFAFYAQREAEVYRALGDLTRRYLSDAASGHTHPFWTDRRDDSAGAADRRAVEAALARLRAADRVVLARGPTLDVRSMPAVSGREIVLEPRIASEEDAAGIRHVADVDVLTLVDVALAHDTVPDIFASYNAHAAPVTLPQFLTALATAVAREWLVVDASGTKFRQP
jgi:flavin-dependent dehydrogenase